MKKSKYRSIIRQVVILPLTVLLFIMFIMVSSCIVSYINVENQMLESNVNALQISLNQLESQLIEIDYDFIYYITSNETYKRMRSLKENSTANDYLLYFADTTTWLKKQADSYKVVEGVFAYYENIDLLMFRGKANRTVHKYIDERIEKADLQYNHWKVVDVNGENYIITIKNYGNYYWGCWIPLNTLIIDYGLDEDKLLGSVYVIDSDHNNTLKDESLNLILKQNGKGIKKVKDIDGSKYTNYSVSSKNKDIFFGILIPNLMIFRNIPLFNKIIFLIATISLLTIPCIIYWLQTRIAKPLKIVDEAMLYIREGDMEYRIPLPDKKYYDEFDRLFLKFNQMMDDLNDLEYVLYKMKINEQRTELKYISQQIRPHFILNALNIIYTYKESEFPLIKKMVLYLSQYFQYIVNLRVDFVELENELRHTENYLMIQKERYPDRFEFSIIASEHVKKCLIPPLIIQTFVENCIKYALKNDEKLLIHITAEEVADKMRIRIEDTGHGFTEEAMNKIERFITTREYQKNLGVGIQNAIERMDILYQENIDIRIINSLSGGAIVELTLPRSV